MSAPALANVFAGYNSDPEASAALEERLTRSGEFAEVWRPNAFWVVGVRALPNSTPDRGAARGMGLVFAEGREAIAGSHGDDQAALAMLADCVENAPMKLDKLAGDFGFLFFRETGEATVVCSCGGAVPFYLWQSGNSAAVSTNLTWMARFAATNAAPDGLVSALWSVGWSWFPDQRSPLAGVSVLSRGTYATFRPESGFEMGCYWNPRPKVMAEYSESDAAERAGRFRELLVGKLTRDLDPDGGNLLTFSGGVDSSALAALAGGLLKRKIWSLSLLPEPEEACRREMSFIEPLASEFGFERHWVHRVSSESQLTMLREAPTVAFPIIHPALCRLPAIQKEAPVRVLFGGEFADRLSGCVSTIPDFVAASSAAETLRHFGFSRLGCQLLLSRAKRLLTGGRSGEFVPFPDDLPDLFSRELREEIRELHDRSCRAAFADEGPWKQLTMFLQLDGWLAMNWEAAGALGIRRSFPFFHRESIELTYACHPAELVGPRTKKILRRALKGDVPDRNLNRDDKGTWGEYLLRGDRNSFRWESSVPDCWSGVLRADWTPSPPKEIDFASAKRLTRLVVFGDSLRTVQGMKS